MITLDHQAPCYDKLANLTLCCLTLGSSQKIASELVHK